MQRKKFSFASPQVPAGNAPPPLSSIRLLTPGCSNMLYAVRRALTVETSAFGAWAPSLVRKIGSVPEVLSNRACTLAGLIVQPRACSWQGPHVLPLLPSDWKIALFGSSAP